MYEDIDFSNIFNDSNSTQEEGGDLSNHQSESAQRPQSLTDETYEYFVKTVSDGRKRKIGNSTMTKQDLRRYADGRIFTDSYT